MNFISRFAILLLLLPVVGHTEDSLLFRARIISTSPLLAAHAIEESSGDTLLARMNELVTAKQAHIVATPNLQTTLGQPSELSGEFKIEFKCQQASSELLHLNIHVQREKDGAVSALTGGIALKPGTPGFLGILQPDKANGEAPVFLIFVHVQ